MKKIQLTSKSKLCEDYIKAQCKNYINLNRIQRIQLKTAGISCDFTIPGIMLYIVDHPHMEQEHRIKAQVEEIKNSLKQENALEVIDYSIEVL